MSLPITNKKAWKLAWRKARQLKRHFPDIKAYFIAERAVDDCVYGGGYDYVPFLAVNQALIYAVHWVFETPNSDVPAFASERHRAFSMSETESRVWFENPRLP